MAFGLVLVAIRVVGVIWPRIFVAVAPYYRGVMPREVSPGHCGLRGSPGSSWAAVGLAVALTA